MDLEGVALTGEQRELCRGGLDERQLRMLKAQVRPAPAASGASDGAGVCLCV